MSVAVVVLTPAPGAEADRLCAALGALPEHVPTIETSGAGLHLPGVVAPAGMGPGAITWDLSLRDGAGLGEALADPVVRDLLGAGAGLVEAIDPVTLEPLAASVVPTPPPLIKRTLLLRVRSETPTALVTRFESDLAEMPDHIPAIRSWRLSRAAGRWTHAWEQEYASIDGLSDDYMLAPFHWTTVDAWFDPEVPGHVVEPELAHLFSERDAPVLV